MHTGPHPLSWHIGLAGAEAARAGDPALATAMLRGMRAYQECARPEPLPPAPCLWESRGVRLLHYPPFEKGEPCGTDGGDPPLNPPLLGGGGPRGALFCLPSLINRARILDLCAERSLARWLAARCVAVYLLDWGELCAAPDTRSLTLGALIDTLAGPAIRAAAQHFGRPVAAAGHCMGGTILMDAASRPEIAAHLSGLAFVAAPWDFHAGTQALRARAAHFAPAALAVVERRGCIPTEGIQALFASVDPAMTARKFAKFAGMEPGSRAARIFLAVEDWLNDGCALPGPIAREVLSRWYTANAPAGRPGGWERPALVIASSKDRLVTRGSAGALAAALPRAELVDPACGHISMVAGTRAVQDVWEPLLNWLARLPKTPVD